MLWRNSLQILLTPDRLDFRLMPAIGLTPMEIGSLPCAPARPDQPLWMPACEALAALIDRRQGQAFRIDIQLSDRLVRYQVLEWRDGIASRAEWRAYARHVFSAVHGETVRDWDFRIDLVPPGRPSLACAIDSALIDTLRFIADKRSSRLIGMRPQFVKLYNRRHFAVDGQQPFWFAVIEERHVCLGVQTERIWRAVRNEAAPDGWRAALPGMIRRVRAGLDPAGTGSLYLCGELAQGGVPPSIEGLPVRATEASFLRGRSVAIPVLEN